MRKKQHNATIRERITNLGFFDWQVSKMLRITPQTFAAWMQSELPEDDERRLQIELLLSRLEGGQHHGAKKEVDGATV